MERLDLWRRDTEAEFCQWYRYQDSALVTLWNITSRSSNFPCRSPQIVICFDMAVEAWLKFGNLLSCMADSFKIPATYFACRRCCCKEKKQSCWTTLQSLRHFHAQPGSSNFHVIVPRRCHVVQTSRYLPVNCRPNFKLLYQDRAMSSNCHGTETCWALNNEIIKQVTSSWSLFTQSSVCICLTRMCS